MPRTLRILLVDPDPAARELVSSELVKALPGCEVVEAEDEAAFERAIASQRYGVVIAEWQLGWSDGVDLLRRVNAAAPETPVVTCTGHGSETAAAEALKAGLADYIVKAPDELWRLGPAVRRAREHAARTAARRLAEERAAFLADATSLLASSLDVDALVSELVRIVIPSLADLAFVDLVTDDGGIRRAAWHHRDADGRALIDEIVRDWPPDPAHHAVGSLVIATGEAAYVRVVDDAFRQRMARSPRHLEIVTALDLTSIVSVPLVARDRTLGAMSLSFARPGRHYRPSDVVFIEDLARRAALAIDNARLYRDSERARAEVARLTTDLQRRVDELQTVLDVIPVGIGIADDAECHRIRVNPAFARSLGISVEDNASLTAPDEELPAFRVLKDGVPVAAEDLPMQYAARTGSEVRDVELDVVHPDGQRVALYEYASPLFDEDGRVRGSVGAFLDISERKRAEERLRFLERASVALNASLDSDETLAQVARLVVPFLADWCAIDVVDDRGTLVRRGGAHADPARETAVRTEPAGFPFRPTSPFHVGRIVEARRPQAARTITDEWFHVHLEDGAQADPLTNGVASVVAIPLVGRHRVLGALSLFSSRPRYGETELALAEELALRLALALENAWLYEEAREANRLRDEFLATVSHELRTPLNAMLGWAHLLRHGAPGPEAVQRGLDAIERNAMAQALLVDDLLDVARVVAGTLRLSPEPVDVGLLVRGAVDAVRPAADAKALRISLDVSPGLPTIEADPQRLRQVSVNLLSNAVKFTPAGGEVAVAVGVAGGMVELAVRDTGVGIAPDFVPHLFDRFRQADSSTTRQHGGLGLGLSIARHLVELHGGEIRAESGGVGQGAEFVVRLPCGPVSVTSRARSEPSPARPGAARNQTLAGLRLLAVEDAADARALIEATLRSAGAQVTVAASAAEAYASFCSERPDAIISDLALPDEDGHALLRRIRALPPSGGGRVPAIALTAFARGSDRTDSLESGFDVHVTKPVAPDELCAVIAELVASRR